MRAGRLPVSGIARPIGRARIETSPKFRTFLNSLGIARPIGRARIETSNARTIDPTLKASPGQLAGRGLKHRLEALCVGRAECIARPIGRARIETSDVAPEPLCT
ncbi:hypothetical protein THIOKS11690001 [Thiocapsa sp. KS1]|nr:hypothetical protein THIOKS11690001 [Thiocapsa sp. KS1]